MKLDDDNRLWKDGISFTSFSSQTADYALSKLSKVETFSIYRLCIFLVDTGCRLGEAIGLIWNDVHDHRVSFWITKSGRSRTVPLTARARESLIVGGARAKGPFSMLNQPNFRAVWNDAKAEIGLGTDLQVVPHILRHTCASRLVQGGIDIRRVQMWLGHQTLQMTMRYAHLATNDLDSCVGVLERRTA